MNHNKHGFLLIFTFSLCMLVVVMITLSHFVERVPWGDNGREAYRAASDSSSNCPRWKQFDVMESYAQHMMQAVPNMKLAMVVLVTSDDFVPGARVVLESYRMHAKRPVDYIALVVEEKLSPQSICLLKQIGFIVINVDMIEPRNRQLPQYSDVFTKLHVFSMDQYDKILFLDADVIVIKNVDELYTIPGVYAAAPDHVRPGINSGVQLIQPSKALFNQLIHNLDRTEEYGRWGDQDYLNYMFEHVMIRLPTMYNITPLKNRQGFAAMYKCHMTAEQKILHLTGPKPWKGDWKANRRNTDRWFDIWFTYHDQAEAKYPSEQCLQTTQQVNVSESSQM